MAAGIKGLSDLPVAVGFHLGVPIEPFVRVAIRHGLVSEVYYFPPLFYLGVSECVL